MSRLFNSELRPDQPRRNILGGLFMGGLVGGLAGAAGFFVVDTLPIFNNQASTHLPLLLKATFGFDELGYKDFLKENALRAAIYYSIPISLALSSAYWSLKWFGREYDPLHHVAGRKRKQGAAAAKASAEATAEAKKFSSLGIKIHTNLQLTRAQEAQSFLFLAGQGGGKTQLINRLLEQVFKRGDKTIIYDIVKCDYTKEVPRDINGNEPVIIAPWFSKTPNSKVAWWNIARDIEDEQDARSFAIGLIPMSGGDNPMWALASRSILVAVLIKLIKEKGQNWGWTDLKDHCYLPVTDLKVIAEQYYLPALISVADAESKTTNSIMINLHSFMSIIFDLEKCWGGLEKRGFSFVNWLMNDDAKYRNVILQGDLSRQELSAGYIRAVTELLVNKMASPSFTSSQKRRIWFILDELKQVGKLECLVKLMEVGRSRGICTVLAMQSIYQLREIYGQDAMAIYKAVTGLKFFGTIKGDDEQAFVSSIVGKRTVQRRNVSQSGTGDGKINQSVSWSAHEEIDIFHPTEFEKLGPIAYGTEHENDKKFIKGLVIGHGSDALVLEWPLFIAEEYRDEKGELLTDILKRESKQDQMAKTEHLSDVFEQPKAVRATADDTQLEQQQTETTEPEAAHAVEADDDKLLKETMNIMLGDSEKPDESHEKSNEVAEELVGEVAENAAVHVVAEALGAHSTLLEIALNADDLRASQTDESESITTSVSSRRTRKPRKYREQENA
ncbi:MAG: hypothetical protein CTY10_01225 [Methylotenera sp.]|nr:MAG: hypothetical protein CTY10_01225 [Methylotenera sp.]